MTNGNEFAFATPESAEYYGQKGLTKREYFAAMAMQGILANSEFLRNRMDVDIHSASVKNADALINELNKQP